MIKDSGEDITYVEKEQWRKEVDYMLKVLKVMGKIVFGVIKNIIWLIFALVIALLILWLLTESGSNIL